MRGGKENWRVKSTLKRSISYNCVVYSSIGTMGDHLLLELVVEAMGHGWVEYKKNDYLWWAKPSEWGNQQAHIHQMLYQSKPYPSAHMMTNIMGACHPVTRRHPLCTTTSSCLTMWRVQFLVHFHEHTLHNINMETILVTRNVYTTFNVGASCHCFSKCPFFPSLSFF